MAKFTQGPWELIGKQGTAIWAGNRIIAHMSDPRSNKPEARANARLMAAAPEMLELLSNILHAHTVFGHSEKDYPMLGAIRRAINSAQRP